MPPTRNLPLSPQQARAIELLARGLSQREIAQEMGVKYSTARTYIYAAYVRLGVRNAAQAGAAYGRMKAELHIYTLSKC